MARARADSPGRHGARSAPISASRFRSKKTSSDGIASGEAQPIPSASRSSRACATQTAREAAGGRPVGVFHGDFQSANLFFSFEGELLAVIDWELVGVGATLNDVGWIATFSDAGSLGRDARPEGRRRGFPTGDELVAHVHGGLGCAAARPQLVPRARRLQVRDHFGLQPGPASARQAPRSALGDHRTVDRAAARSRARAARVKSCGGRRGRCPAYRCLIDRRNSISAAWNSSGAGHGAGVSSPPSGRRAGCPSPTSGARRRAPRHDGVALAPEDQRRQRERLKLAPVGGELAPAPRRRSPWTSSGCSVTSGSASLSAHRRRQHHRGPELLRGDELGQVQLAPGGAAETLRSRGGRARPRESPPCASRSSVPRSFQVALSKRAPCSSSTESSVRGPRFDPVQLELPDLPSANAPRAGRPQRGRARRSAAWPRSRAAKRARSRSSCARQRHDPRQKARTASVNASLRSPATMWPGAADVDVLRVRAGGRGTPARPRRRGCRSRGRARAASGIVSRRAAANSALAVDDLGRPVGAHEARVPVPVLAAVLAEAQVLLQRLEIARRGCGGACSRRSRRPTSSRLA